MTAQASSFDPELESIPKPRRPWRRLTLGTMGVTAVLSLWLALALTPSVKYALSSNEPVELGALASASPPSTLNNRWVHARADLQAASLEYQRPLDGDTFRLARAEGNPDIWVEVRIPAGLDPRHYVPPTSFVGRLVRTDRAGLRHRAIPEAVSAVTGQRLGDPSWLLIDGEAPRDVTWVLGVVVLLFGFAIFNVWGVFHLSRRVRDA